MSVAQEIEKGRGRSSVELWRTVSETNSEEKKKKKKKLLYGRCKDWVSKR